MRLGTKSVLFGIHCPPIHSFFMFKAWIEIYGWSKELLDPRLHFAFLLHDIGYWGCESMDGPDGEDHPWAGARAMGKMFGPQWGNFCLTHSGTMVEKLNAKGEPFEPSKLYSVDKLASTLYPAWLYKLLSGWSGEWKEYAEIHFGFKQELDYGMHHIALYKTTTEPLPSMNNFSGTGYMDVFFEDWHTDAMRRMKKRALMHANEGKWMTMHEAVKEKWDD